MGKRVRRPKRLFRAIVACGVALTACGAETSPDDGGTDALADGPSKKDGGVAFPDAFADVYEPPKDAAFDGVVIIGPPPPIT
jgi:hypothetical protein